MSQVPVWKRSFDRWSPEETDVLINAWAPLYRRRRRGTKDAWVPLYIRGRARSSRALVTEDWRAVAFAVNSYRAITARLDSCRTHLQCKKRVEHLKRQYVKGLAPRLGWPFFSVLHAVWADEVGDRGAGAVEGRGAPAADAGGTAAAGAYDGAAADDEGGSAAGNADRGTAAVDDFGPSGDERGIAMVDARASAAAAEGFVPGGDASRGSAVEAPDGAVVIEGAAAAGDAGGTASVDARGGAFVHEDCRAAAVAVNSCRTSDGISSERTHKQCRGRVKPLSYTYEKKHDAVFGAAVGEERGGVGDASGGASVDGCGAAAEAARRRATFVPPPIPKRPRSAKPAASSANMAVDDGEARSSEPAEATVADLSAEALAAGSVDAVVVMNLAEKYKEQTTKLAEIYKELRMKMLDVEMEKAAAGHAGAGRRA